MSCWTRDGPAPGASCLPCAGMGECPARLGGTGPKLWWLGWDKGLAVVPGGMLGSQSWGLWGTMAQPWCSGGGKSPTVVLGG